MRMRTAALLGATTAAIAAAAAGCGAEPGAPCDGCVLVEGFGGSTIVTGLAADRQDRLLATVAGRGAGCGLSVARMDAGGALDPTFGVVGTAAVPTLAGFSRLGEPQHALVAMADGSIRIGGDDPGGSRSSVVGFTPDGLDDGLRLGRDESRAALVLMKQDGALVVGYYTGELEGRLLRYAATGEPDASFPAAEAEEATALAPDGGFVMAGATRDMPTRTFYARRATRDGAPDPSFGGGARVFVPDVLHGEGRVLVAPSAAGGLILAGDAASDRRLLVARFDGTGRLDPSFGGGRGFVLHDVFGRDPGGREGPRAIAELADGRIVVAGWFADGGPTHAAAAVLAADGALDPSFGEDGVLVVGAEDSTFTSMAVLASGAVIAGGQIDDRAALARLLPR